VALSADERKMWLGHGGLARIARRTRRTLGHVSQVNAKNRPDPVVQRAITRAIVEKNPDIRPDDVWPQEAA
jgi:hypothetical protein